MQKIGLRPAKEFVKLRHIKEKVLLKLFALTKHQPRQIQLENDTKVT